jgi:hypothetical protein
LIGKSSINRLAGDVVPLFARPLPPRRSILSLSASISGFS